MLHLAEVAAEQRIDPASLGLRQIIVAGEPGGSVPAVRERIEGLFQARLLDHAGATEVGPWGYSDRGRRGLLVNEHDFLVEFHSHATGAPAGEGELSEMIVTGLGRAGCPVIRYRTGDLVRPRWNHDDPCRFVLLDGGVLGRADDMLVIRGVNVFPSSLDQILRGFPEVAEYRITASRAGQLDQIAVEVEDRADHPDRIARELELRLGLRVAVRSVPPGSLPRTEGKGKRFVDRRNG
jgi:phenylacetate-CoA ligase